MESVHSLKLKFNIAPNYSIIVWNFNAHISQHKVSSLDSELALHRHKNGILENHITTSHFLCCMHLVEKHGEYLLRQLINWVLLVLNGRTKLDIRGESTFVWDVEQWRSALGLAITPKNLIADMEVDQVWDASQI